MDNLTKDCVRTMELGYGCHYGRYKADHPQPIPERASPPAEEVDEMSVCPGCGKRFTPKTRRQKYCCTQCGVLHRYQVSKRDVVPEMAKCKVCGKEFPAGSGRKYCSDACRLRRHREYGRAKNGK